MRKAAVFFYVTLNGTWAFAAYLVHKVGVPLRAAVFVLSTGVILGNLAAYAGVKLATKLLARRRSF
jgi:hypothetical protein